MALDPGIDLSKTEFLSRMIQRWGKLPLTLLNRVDLRNYRYGFVGTEDWFMYPIIPPGSLVVIDDSRRRVANSGWTNEFDRPDLLPGASGAAMHAPGAAFATTAWFCSHIRPRDASRSAMPIPEEIEVIGQITEVAMSLDPAKRRRPRA